MATRFICNPHGHVTSVTEAHFDRLINHLDKNDDMEVMGKNGVSHRGDWREATPAEIKVITDASDRAIAASARKEHLAEVKAAAEDAAIAALVAKAGK
jgi:hypothetical protein